MYYMHTYTCASVASHISHFICDGPVVLSPTNTVLYISSNAQIGVIQVRVTDDQNHLVRCHLCLDWLLITHWNSLEAYHDDLHRHSTKSSTLLGDIFNEEVSHTPQLIARLAYSSTFSKCWSTSKTLERVMCMHTWQDYSNIRVLSRKGVPNS